MTLWLFLRAYWKPLFILVLLIAGIVTLDRWGAHREKEGYNRAQAEAKVELEKWREHEREVDAEVVTKYGQTVEDLENRVTGLQHGNSIRLCKPANQVRQPNPTGTAGDSTGGSALQAGEDIRPELVQYGGQCEKLRQQLAAIKTWQESLQR